MQKPEWNEAQQEKKKSIHAGIMILKKTHQSSLEDAKKPTARDNHEQHRLLSLNFCFVLFFSGQPGSSSS